LNEFTRLSFIYENVLIFKLYLAIDNEFYGILYSKDAFNVKSIFFHYILCVS